MTELLPLKVYPSKASVRGHLQSVIRTVYTVCIQETSVQNTGKYSPGKVKIFKENPYHSKWTHTDDRDGQYVHQKGLRQDKIKDCVLF